jgi:hypothetical protein
LSNCKQNFEFNVTGTLVSTKYAHLERCRPMTMGLDVTVTDPSEDLQWHAELRRRLGSDWVMYWLVDITDSSLSDLHAYIDDIADDAGEYPDWWDSSEWGGRIRIVSMNALPQEIQQVFADRLEDEREDLCYYDDEQCDADAFYGEPMAEILRGGEVVGYLLSIEYYFNDSLFDGGGVWVYFDYRGEEVTSMEWWG